MRGAGRVDGQRARIAEIGHVVEELERIDKSDACLATLLELETDETAVLAEIDVGAAALFRILMQTRVNDPPDIGMTLQIECDFRSVAAVLAHPKRQRLQPLD